jgi:phosphatidylglycerophosphate synthase
MFTKYKKKIEPLIAIIAQPFLSWNPNILTLLSVLFAGIFVISLSWHNFSIAAISWIGVVFDALDGYVARGKAKVTAFGAFFDSTTDRISDFCYISAFGFAELIDWKLVTLALVTTFLISYIKARSESLLVSKRVLDRGFMQRSERLVFVFVTFLLFAFHVPYIALLLFLLFIVLNVVTIFQRIYVAYQCLQ